MTRQGNARHEWFACSLLAVAATLAFHLGTLARLTSQVLGDPTGDVPIYHLSILAWVRQNLLSGHLPLWNPLIFCGYPQWAEGQLALVGPLGPLLLLPVAAALNLWWIVLHAALALAATWWLSSLGVRAPVALLGALSIAFSGVVAPRIAGGHPNLVSCYPAMFIVAGAWNRWWDRESPRMLLPAILAWGFVLWSAHLQTAAHLAAWWILMTLAGTGLASTRNFRRWALGAAAVFGVGTLSASALLFPSFEFGMLSRRTALSVYNSSTFSFPIENLLTLFIPGAFGTGLSISASPYLGRWYHVWETSAFLNPALILALFLPRASARPGATRGLWVAAGVLFLLALGRQAPLFQAAFGLIPGFGLFRCHGRLIAPVLFSLTALACLGIEGMLRDPKPTVNPGSATWMHRLMQGGLAACAAALLLLVAARLFPGSAAGNLVRLLASIPLLGPKLELFPAIPPGTSLRYFAEEADAATRARVFLPPAISAATIWLLLLGACFAAAKFPSRRRILLPAIGIGSVCYCLWCALPFTVRTDAAKPAVPAAAATVLRNLTHEGRAMLLGIADRNALVRENIPVAGGYAALLATRQNTLLQLAQNHPPDTQESQSNAWELTPLYRWLGVSALASTDPDADPGAQFGKAAGDNAMRVWKVPDPVPLAFLVDGGIAASSFDAAVARLRDISAPVGNSVVLETSEPLPAATSPPRPVKLQRPSPGTIVADLNGAPAGWVVVLESLLPGWKARVDGQAAAIVPAQAAFQAVKTREGSRTLRLSYEPASFRFGLFLTLAILAALGCLARLVPPKGVKVRPCEDEKKGAKARRRKR